MAGSTLPWSRSAYRYARSEGGAAKSTVVNYGLRTSAENAAFVNGTFGHGIEMDDNHAATGIKGGCVVIRAALAVAEQLFGGEQALTALSLLFGVFLTNPAPVCVLDEVDAPLDDANVDRFCSMLTEMAASGRTRFMVVTHHHMTMARMDRLFGVTMAERGVSQLVSVDLHQAEKLRATA